MTIPEAGYLLRIFVGESDKREGNNRTTAIKAGEALRKIDPEAAKQAGVTEAAGS